MVTTTQERVNLQPGFQPRRLALLMQDAIERCKLNLRGRIVLTEAASGAYVVTPVIAAMAGAKNVFAITKATRYGTVAEVTEETRRLARLVGVEDQIEIVPEKTRELVAHADIVTNSGHVRPIDAETISWMKPSAVITLMYEAWEFRVRDVDLDACRQRGILVAGTNERHPAVDVFSFLGIMAIKLLTDAGIATYKSRILLICDNPFTLYLTIGLRNAGAVVDLVRNRVDVATRIDAFGQYDAILVAQTPRRDSLLGADNSILSARQIANRFPSALVAQFWGDIDREALSEWQIPYWPVGSVDTGHMGILPSAIGPEPIVRLQSGGLKVGELLSQDPCQFEDRHGAYMEENDRAITFLSAL